MRFYTYRETEEHSTNALPVAYYKVDERHPRYEMRHHWHKEYELILVNSGSLKVTLDAETFTLAKDDIIFVNPGVIHSGAPASCNYECVVFKMGQQIKQYLSDYSEGKALLFGEKTLPPFCAKENAEAKENALKLIRAMRNKEKGFELEAVSAISGLFATVLKNGLLLNSEETSRRFAERLLPFENAVSYIENNFARPVALEELAKKAGMSRKYFSEYFKKISGKSPMEYINSYRIERACEMLQYTDLSVTRIALDCGFNDLSYFIKTFKYQKNATPSHYRNKVKL